MADIKYQNLDLLIKPEKNGYRTEVHSPVGEVASNNFRMPFSEQELTDFLERVSQPWRSTQAIDSPELKAARDFGGRLFSAVFDKEPYALLRGSLVETSSRLRIRLWLTEVPELAYLPWEFLYDPDVGGFLSLRLDIPIVRYIGTHRAIRPLALTPPLRILAMFSTPAEYTRIDVEQEWARMAAALSEPVQRGIVELDLLDGATLTSLQERLRSYKYNIFHFAGHGRFDRKTQEGMLLMQDEDKQDRWVSAERLGYVLRDHPSLRLAVINSSEGARTSLSNTFGGTAQSLVQQGIPAVIAMQFSMSDRAAMTFSRGFYAAVADGYPVDAALTEARKEISSVGDSLEWANPVLYTSSSDGNIFELPSSDKVLKAGAPEMAAMQQPEGMASERIEIATRALADTWSEIDLLGFSDYADALADFIKNEKTQKPLTIGIDAAWGMGKTTLMHMIETRLAGPEKDGGAGQSFPMVWFNAWKYDKEESLWAALVLQILADIQDKLHRGWLRRELFWMKLNWRRFDKEKLLHDVLKRLVYLVGFLLLGVAVFGIAKFWAGNPFQIEFPRYLGIVGSLGLIPILYASGKEAYDQFVGALDLKIAKYVREPDYKERIGFLAEFEQDFKYLIDVVTANGKWPLVVFIDDLDRCSPPKPVEIIEAINTVLDAKHCVFVIGMDSQAVASSIEAKYKDLRNYTDDADGRGGLRLGEHFLEKIVQINFRVPSAIPNVVDSFINATLGTLTATLAAGQSKPGEGPLRRSEEIVSEAEHLIKAEQRGGKLLDEAADIVQAARPDITVEVVEAAKEEIRTKSLEESADAQRAIHDAAPYLGFNPRKIKRFINIFRLQALIAYRRGLLKSDDTRLGLFAKAILIATRWPDVVRAIMADFDFVKRLAKAHQTREEVRRLQLEEPEDHAKVRTTQASLDILLNDLRIKRFIDFVDLIELLSDMSTDEIAEFRDYLQLAQITAKSPDLGSVN